MIDKLANTFVIRLFNELIKNWTESNKSVP